jgi:beta-mannosidase
VVTLDWQLRGCLGDEWQWHLTKPWDAPHWLPARVPGSVMDDLMRAGELPDLYRARNSRVAEWVPERTWIYRTRVAGPGILRFGGIDFGARVFLDGEQAAEVDSMYRPLDVQLGSEHSLLCVVIPPAPESEPQVGRTSRVRVHKPRLGYGWDFCPRLVHQGIWRSVELLSELPGEPESVPPRAVLQDDLTLLVDGKTEPIRGWNWCPLDPLYGVPRPEKLRRLLQLAADAHVNLLRVWGGGLLESDEFYDECDRLGIAVWQEFSQSSSGIESVPSQDPAFVEQLLADARSEVVRLRRHPSLTVWGGGNELARRVEGREDDVPLDDSDPVLGALREVVRELDPDRAWLPTSPTGPRFLHRADLDMSEARDVHGPWEHQGLRAHYALWDAPGAPLHSEFGVEGMANRPLLDRLVPADEQWPADRSNPVYEHLGAWWNNAALVQECFGGRIEDVETMRRASQWLQYDGLRYAVEALIRRGAGCIPWQFAESYPNAWCTAAVGWDGDPKPAYWGVKRAYGGAPSARFATCTWGGAEEVRIEGDGRIVDLYGNEIANGKFEISSLRSQIASAVFLVDLHGANRYVMTTAADLAPLLDLPEARVERNGDRIRNVGDVAAIGLVWGDVIDLLPGEERTVEGEFEWGWNVPRAPA